MIEISVTGVPDWDALGRHWRSLEGRVALSFFQSWSWVGCLAAERYPDPVLVEARTGGETVGLALFNRTRHGLRETLALHETGDPSLDTPFIEHNGVLGDAAAPVMRALLTHLPLRRLCLSGVDDRTLAAADQAAGWLWILRTRAAPFADLTTDFLQGRSANTRQQLRRSDRAYGEVEVRRASEVAEAKLMLDEMEVLHQASWQSRGQPGAFAKPFFSRFHHALVERSLPRGEVDLLRITAHGRTIGVLYNFRFRARALAYQSGFDYGGAKEACKPGLTCHHAAIRFAASEGLRQYDFLAGDDRYKRSLSDGSVRLHWCQAGPLTDLSLGLRCAGEAVRDAGAKYLAALRTQAARRPDA